MKSPAGVCERGLIATPDNATIQLGAENNIEKSRCLAQLKKNIRDSESRASLVFQASAPIGRIAAELSDASLAVISGM